MLSETESEHSSVMFCATASVDSATETRLWKETKYVIDKVHLHICAHSHFTDIRTLLETNGLWNENKNKNCFLSLETYAECKTVALPKPARVATLISLFKEFNDFLYIW